MTSAFFPIRLILEDFDYRLHRRPFGQVHASRLLRPAGRHQEAGSWAFSMLLEYFFPKKRVGKPEPEIHHVIPSGNLTVCY